MKSGSRRTRPRQLPQGGAQGFDRHRGEKRPAQPITFKARKTLDASKGGPWQAGDTATLDLTMWIENTKKSGSDEDADVGDRIYIDPESNEYNTFVWGDDRAALEYHADDNAKAFYARLSTKADIDIYTDYGDPVDADLWFYNFIGNPEIPSTSRAWLTLGIPWTRTATTIPTHATSTSTRWTNTAT